MADHLARIFGTEEDKVNCPFYFKIGACRHGDRCSRLHLKPTFSQTLLLPHLYLPSQPGPNGEPVDDTERFEEFYEEIFDELSKYGEIEELHVCDNLGDHMLGNVYVKFHTEEMAEKALNGLQGRYYAGRVVLPEYSPVTDFREARCRQYDEDSCSRKGYCNFMHLKKLTRRLRDLVRPRRSSRRSHSRDRHGDRDRDHHRSDREHSSRRRSRSRDRSRRDRSRDRGDRDRESSRRGRDRSRDRGDKERDSRRYERDSSAERRAMIEQWNKEKDDAEVKAPEGEQQPPADVPAAAPAQSTEQPEQQQQ